MSRNEIAPLPEFYFIPSSKMGKIHILDRRHKSALSKHRVNSQNPEILSAGLKIIFSFKNCQKFRVYQSQIGMGIIRILSLLILLINTDTYGYSY